MLRLYVEIQPVDSLAVMEALGGGIADMEAYLDAIQLPNDHPEAGYARYLARRRTAPMANFDSFVVGVEGRETVTEFCFGNIRRFEAICLLTIDWDSYCGDILPNERGRLIRALVGMHPFMSQFEITNMYYV